MKRSLRRFLLPVLLLATWATAPAGASTLQLVATDTGFYFASGDHVFSNQNHLTGRLSGIVRHSVFVFDLSGVS